MAKRKHPSQPSLVLRVIHTHRYIYSSVYNATEKWDRIESPYIYGQLIFKRGDKTIQWGETILF